MANTHAPPAPPATGEALPAPRRVLGPLGPMLEAPAAGGIALGVAAVIALVWANAAPAAYTELWTTPVVLDVGGRTIVDTYVAEIVKNALMSVFFLVVGLEIKRELVIGELQDRRVAVLPLFAAVGGMVLPVAVFLAVTGGGPAASGWGIPMATDIAFALAALRLLGARVPVQLLALMLAIAVIDDIGAILVIAVAYSGALAPAWLAASLVALVAVAVAVRMRVTSITLLTLGLLVAWVCMAYSGVSPTIAAVAFGLLMPARPTATEPSWPGPERSILERMEHGLAPWSAFVVLPVFALAFAGIRVDAGSLADAASSRVAIGVALGLVVGKTLGVTLGALAARATGLGRLAEGVSVRHVVGVGALAGIGFTVALFVATLAYTDPGLVDEARIGILAGSIAAAVVGLALLGSSTRR